MNQEIQPLPMVPAKDQIKANAAAPCGHCGQPVGTLTGMFSLTCSTCGSGIHFSCSTARIMDEAGSRNEPWCPAVPEPAKAQ